MKSESPATPLPTAAQYILLALAGRDLHGYGIVQEVTQLSGGTYRVGPGTLYDNLRKLMAGGLVSDARRPPNDADDRRFYQITAAGRNVLAIEVSRLKKIVAAHSRLREPKSA